MLFSRVLKPSEVTSIKLITVIMKIWSSSHSVCMSPRVSADVGGSDKTAAAVGEPDKRGSDLITGALGGRSSTLRDQLHPPSHCQQTKHSGEKENPGIGSPF